MHVRPEKTKRENEEEPSCGDKEKKKTVDIRVSRLQLRNRILLITAQATLVTVLVVLAQFSDNSESPAKKH